jgi:glycosyltransferase involved in cell wall biosynthesis
VGPVPVLSVLVLSYNYGHYVGTCLDSILGQTFTDYELIVINDASSDNTREVLAKYQADPRVRVVHHEKNTGFVASLIEGTEVHSRGEFRLVISADDGIESPHAFERQIASLRANPERAFCFSDVVRFYDDGSMPTTVHHSFPEDTTHYGEEAFRILLTNRSVWPCHSGAMLRADAYFRAGGYRRDLTMPLDLAMWLALAMEGGFSYCAEPLYRYRVHHQQMSTKKVEQNTKEVVSAIEIACEMAESRGLHLAGLRLQGLRTHLGGNLMYDAFNGQSAVAFRRLVSSVRHAPAAVLSSRDAWLAGLRMALGRQPFQFLQRFAGGARANG